jgi:hypothetical protein
VGEAGEAGAGKSRLAVERWASGRRTTVLVRPDGYVAWAAEPEGAGRTVDASAIRSALADAGAIDTRSAALR